MKKTFTKPLKPIYSAIEGYTPMYLASQLSLLETYPELSFAWVLQNRIKELRKSIVNVDLPCTVQTCLAIPYSYYTSPFPEFKALYEEWANQRYSHYKYTHAHMHIKSEDLVPEEEPVTVISSRKAFLTSHSMPFKQIVGIKHKQVTNLQIQYKTVFDYTIKTSLTPPGYSYNVSECGALRLGSSFQKEGVLLDSFTCYTPVSRFDVGRLIVKIRGMFESKDTPIGKMSLVCDVHIATTKLPFSDEGTPSYWLTKMGMNCGENDTFTFYNTEGFKELTDREVHRGEVLMEVRFPGDSPLALNSFQLNQLGINAHYRDYLFGMKLTKYKNGNLRPEVTLYNRRGVASTSREHWDSLLDGKELSKKVHQTVRSVIASPDVWFKLYAHNLQNEEGEGKKPKWIVVPDDEVMEQAQAEATLKMLRKGTMTGDLGI